MDYVTVKVTRHEIGQQVASLGLNGEFVCLHACPESFEHVDGGADTIIDTFLDAGCTIMVPTFSGAQLEVRPHPDQMIERNGWDATRAQSLPVQSDVVYSPDLDLVDESMGAISAAVLRRTERCRGNHPHNSFTAVGPRAHLLVDDQAWDDVYAPLRELTKQRGYVLLSGVGLNRMTLLHFAEGLAGRRQFRRWATDSNGDAVPVSVRSCSEGFPNFEQTLGNLAQEATLGRSACRLFPAAESVTASAALIRTEPGITHCGDPECVQCPHAIAGGPIL